MDALQKIPKDPPVLIQLLLANDPRLPSHHTKRQYKSDLLQFEEWRRGREITKTLVEAYAAELQGGGYAPNTINQRLAAIRWYARKVTDLSMDYVGRENPQAARVALVKDVKGERPERGRHIDPSELSALLRACIQDKNRAAGIRDAALFALAWSTGLRRDEISRIELEHMTPSEDGIDIAVLGKGNKIRTAYINDGALDALQDWLKIRGNDPGRLFQNVNKSGKVTGGKLSGEALRKLLWKRSLQAGLAQEITWHDFRRTFAGNLWGAGIDGSTIQKLMGHASQDQTAKYDRRPEQLRRKAVRVLHVPYKSVS